MKTLARLIRNESGATAIEYALIAAAIAVAIIVAITALGVDIAGVFTSVSDAM